jgi:hypothetical protein
MDANYLHSQFDTLGSPAAVSGTEPPQQPFTVSDVPLPGGRRGTH